MKTTIPVLISGGKEVTGTTVGGDVVFLLVGVRAAPSFIVLDTTVEPAVDGTNVVSRDFWDEVICALEEESCGKVLGNTAVVTDGVTVGLSSFIVLNFELDETEFINIV